jgi:thioredoxin 1
MEVINVKSEFDSAKAKGLVLVDFYADWCGPCKMLGPVLEEVGKNFGDKVRIIKVDSDVAEELASEYQVNSIPLLILFKDGIQQDALLGYKTKAELTKFINKYL